MKLSKRENAAGYLSILPIFLFSAIFFYYPTLSTLYYSFTQWDGVESTWVGFRNFIRIFSNGELWMLLRNNFIFLITYPCILIICLIVTILLFEEVAGWKFFRSVLYIPTILSAVVVGFLMKIMFSYHGMVNETLQSIGLSSLTQDWLNQVPTAFAVLIFCYFWQTLGQGVLIFLAGMSTVSGEMFDASNIDGAGWWQRLFYISIPSLVQPIFYFTFINVTWIFIGLFPLVYSVTGGGPGYGTTPIDYMIYLKGFQATGEMGYASALSVILFMIVMLVSWIQFKVSEKFSD